MRVSKMHAMVSPDFLRISALAILIGIGSFAQSATPAGYWSAQTQVSGQALGQILSQCAVQQGKGHRADYHETWHHLPRIYSAQDSNAAQPTDMCCADVA